MREVTVEIPDRDDAEQAVRMVAAQWCAGNNVAVLPIPPPLDLRHVGAVHAILAEAQAKLAVTAEIAARRN